MDRNTGLANLAGETMGTTWRVCVHVPRSADLHALHHVIQSRLDDIVRQMSTWEAASDISAYNRADAGSWQPLRNEFRDVLACALEIAGASDGAFDPALGTLVGLWGFGANAQPGPPHPASLHAKTNEADWRRIQLNAAQSRVLQPGGVQLDLSAIAKGYGVDHVVAGLLEAGIDNALVEVGGELYGYGRKPDGNPWRVLVESGPDDDSDDTPPRVVALEGIAIATSGDRWHAYQHEGRSYSHTIDPRSAAPVELAAAAVSVIATDAMRADAWATAMTVMGSKTGLEFAARHGLAVRYLEREGDITRERMSDAFCKHLAEA